MLSYLCKYFSDQFLQLTMPVAKDAARIFFENALVKILNIREEDLKCIEKDAISLLKRSDGQPRSTVTASSCCDFAADLLKKRKLELKS